MAAKLVRLRAGASTWRSALPLALVLGVAAGCYKLNDDDCGLAKECLLAESYAQALGEQCAGCLRRDCARVLRECAADAICDEVARCRLKSNPVAFQDCLADLLAMDASVADGPWDGRLDNPFESCLEDQCADDCKQRSADWSCVEGGGYEVDDDKRVATVIAAKLLRPGGFQALSAADVYYCSHKDLCDPVGRTDENGILAVPEGRVFRLHVKLEKTDGSVDFPTTYFYPRPLSGSPITVYAVASEIVRAGNSELLGIPDAGVLEQQSQAIFLPDSCRLQATLSARDVTIQVRDTSAPLCAGDGDTPCTWYGDATDGYPELGLDRSRGRTTGILGLPRGEHEVQVCSGSGELVASQKIWMEPNAITIARLRPLTRSDRAGLGADLCAKSPSLPLARGGSDE